MKRVLRFLVPRREVGQLPLGRVSIAAQLLAMLIFLGFTLIKMGVNLPLVSSPYTIEVVFANASGLDADDRPAAGVAGLALGRVTDVRFEDGRAVATLKLDGQVRGKLFRDASAEIRPLSSINALSVNILPGTPANGALPEDARIPATRSGTHVEAQQLVKELDVDTRAYLQIVLGEAQASLRGRGGELRGALDQLGPLTDPSARVADALADRRRLLARLVGELDVVFGELATRRDRLTEVVSAGSDTLAVTSARRAELEESLRRLPPTLEAASGALASGRRLSRPLVPALVDLRQAARPLPPALRDARRLVPDARGLLRDTDLLIRDGRVPVRTLAEVATDLEPFAADARRPVRELGEILAVLNARKSGIAQTSELLSGAVSRNDANGPFLSVVTFPENPRPENFGFPSSLAASSDGRERFERKLDRALETMCERENVAACTLLARLGHTWSGDAASDRERTEGAPEDAPAKAPADRAGSSPAPPADRPGRAPALEGTEARP